jgi:hypothetical protein
MATVDRYTKPNYTTPRLEDFIEWVYEESAITFPSKAQKEAFEMGLKVGPRAYGLFQAAERAKRENATNEKVAPSPMPTRRAGDQPAAKNKRPTRRSA